MGLIWFDLDKIKNVIFPKKSTDCENDIYLQMLKRLELLKQYDLGNVDFLDENGVFRTIVVAEENDFHFVEEIEGKFIGDSIVYLGNGKEKYLQRDEGALEPVPLSEGVFLCAKDFLGYDVLIKANGINISDGGNIEKRTEKLVEFLSKCINNASMDLDSVKELNDCEDGIFNGIVSATFKSSIKEEELIERIQKAEQQINQLEDLLQDCQEDRNFKKDYVTEKKKSSSTADFTFAHVFRDDSFIACQTHRDFNFSDDYSEDYVHLNGRFVGDGIVYSALILLNDKYLEHSNKEKYKERLIYKSEKLVAKNLLGYDVSIEASDIDFDQSSEQYITFLTTCIENGVTDKNSIETLSKEYGVTIKDLSSVEFSPIKTLEVTGGVPVFMKK